MRPVTFIPKSAFARNPIEEIGDALEADMKAGCGVSPSHFQVLMALAEAPDGQLRMVDIASKNCISRSGVTQSVDRLEKLGRVTRVTSPGDRRLVLATITPAGRDVVPIGHLVFQEVADRFIADRLGQRQAIALQAALLKIASTDG